MRYDTENMPQIVVGQECICTDGLGRVVDWKYFCSAISRVKVDTYVNNRSCWWDAHNVTLLKIQGIPDATTD